MHTAPYYEQEFSKGLINGTGKTRYPVQMQTKLLSLPLQIER